MAYQIEITPTGLAALESITDWRTRAAITRRIDALTEEPTKQEMPCGANWLDS